MRRINSDKFNFYVEANTFTKGTNDNGDAVIWVDGVASSSRSADSDDEVLYPVGFNTAPLIESGLCNYNHNGAKDSNANVGIPTEARVINNGKDLYIKCMLWPCPQTEGIIRMAENFEKYSPTRKMGFSIEGRATKRGSNDKKSPLYKQILAADVTGVAITASPKNKNTLMNIIKGEYETPYIEDTDDDIINLDDLVTEYNEWVGDDSHRGTKGNVKEFLENYHEDNISLLEDLVKAINAKTEKATTTTSIAPATPESVEHNPKDISGGNTNIFGDIIKKSEIYTLISNRYPSLPIAEYKRIYAFVEKVQEKITA